MDITVALAGLSALAHDGRLSIFRLLVKAGPDGVAAGDIARKLATQPNTLSAQIERRPSSGLVRARRQGRSIIYTVDFAAMSDLLLFLTKDCCGGRAEICAPLAQTVNACCPPRKRA